MLAAGDDDQVLSFSTLAVLATAPDGTLIDGRIKPLIRLLRPDVSTLVIISFFNLRWSHTYICLAFFFTAPR